MAEELSYVIVTPYSIRKSRTGGIIARLISRTGLEIVGARMFAPSKALTEKYASTIVTDPEPRHRATQELIKEYVPAKFQPDGAGYPAPRPDAGLPRRGCHHRKFAGRWATSSMSGRAARRSATRMAITSRTRTARSPISSPRCSRRRIAASAAENLKLWASYSDQDGGLLDDAIEFSQGGNVQKTLVLIKPDNFRFPNARPGGVIDLFSRTGLYIIGFKVHRMSVAQAEEFYRPVLDVLMDKLKEPSGIRARLAFEREFGFPLSEDVQRRLGDLLGPLAGRENWESIVKFMSGMKPSECPAGPPQ